MADLRRPVGGTGRSKPAGQDLVLDVSKVASISATGAPAVGHYAQIATMRRCHEIDGAGPYGGECSGPARSAHSYSVCRNRMCGRARGGGPSSCRQHPAATAPPPSNRDRPRRNDAMWLRDLAVSRSGAATGSQRRNYVEFRSDALDGPPNDGATIRGPRIATCA